MTRIILAIVGTFAGIALGLICWGALALWSLRRV